MSTDMKRVGGNIAVIAACVVGGYIVLRLLGGVIRVILSVVLVGVVIYVILKLLKLVR